MTQLNLHITNSILPTITPNSKLLFEKISDVVKHECTRALHKLNINVAEYIPNSKITADQLYCIATPETFIFPNDIALGCSSVLDNIYDAVIIGNSKHPYAVICSSKICSVLNDSLMDMSILDICQSLCSNFKSEVHTCKFDVCDNNFYIPETSILKYAKDKNDCFKVLEAATDFSVSDLTKYHMACEDYKKIVFKRFIESGVIFLSFSGVIISPFAVLDKGVTIHANCEIRNNVTIGSDSDIGPSSIIQDSSIGENCIVNATQIYSSTLENNVKIGPFSHIRPNSYLKNGAKIGDFVEIKNSTIGQDTHASHLTYIGDSDVGDRVNFGCGVVTVNYDGANKHRTTIGNDVFVGCNSNLVAPVTLGDHAYTAAGSTITEDVPAESLAIARARQVNKNNWSRPKK